jgi:hypothetical protein
MGKTRRALMLFSVIGLFQVAGQAGARPQTDPTAEISKFEQGFSAALAGNDVGALEHYVSDDWRIVSGDGVVISRARFLSVVASGDLKHEKMSSQDQTIRLYGDTALVTARTQSAGSYKGAAFRTDEIGTDVIVRDHGRWVCVLTQLTTVAPR